MLKKSNFAAIGAALLLCSTAATAAVSNNSLTFRWNGAVPVDVPVGGSWTFASPLDPTKPFNPTPGVLNILDGNTKGEKTLSVDPVPFVLATSGAGKFVDSSAVNAYLIGSPSISGLTPKAGAAASDVAVFELSLNGRKLEVGSSRSVEVAKAGTGSTVVDMELTGNGSMPEKAYTGGDNVQISAIIMVSADV